MLRQPECFHILFCASGPFLPCLEAPLRDRRNSFVAYPPPFNVNVHHGLKAVIVIVHGVPKYTFLPGCPIVPQPIVWVASPDTTNALSRKSRYRDVAHALTVSRIRASVLSAIPGEGVTA